MFSPLNPIMQNKRKGKYNKIINKHLIIKPLNKNLEKYQSKANIKTLKIAVG